MSAHYFELAVVVTEKPAITFVARCGRSVASCTSGGEYAAKRAVAKELERSGRLSGLVSAHAISLTLRTHAGYRRTYVARYTLGELRKCRVCGCTDEDCRQCIERTGEPCSWVEEDLCSACAPAGKRRGAEVGKFEARQIGARKGGRKAVAR